MDLHSDQIGLREKSLETVRGVGQVIQQRNRPGKCDSQNQFVGLERGLVEQQRWIVRGTPIQFAEQTFHHLKAPGMNPEAGLNRDEL